ncbi:renalase-like [Antedon mediterranea]|uniref:renalase-like n=1 Tax=Antedon mediterranea TaxID=105859 RepID=UPI003AF7814E
MIPRVLIVGAGLTGATTALLLQRELQQRVSIAIWETARGSGGRMNTNRSNSNPKASADLGAQYISCSPAYATLHAEFYDELLTNDILKPCSVIIEGLKEPEPGTKHYIAPSGINLIVKFYLQQSGVTVDHNRNLNTIDVQVHDDVESILAGYKSGDKKTPYDVVLLTQPVPKLFQLEGGIHSILTKNSDVLRKLQDVEYSSRYALGLYYPPGTKIDVEWAGKYTYDDPCIRWICIDNKKREQESNENGPTVVVHTSVPFGLKHLEDNKEDVQQLILQHLSTLLPNLPDPIEVKCQRWRYSQVYKGIEGSPGCLKLMESKSGLLLMAGDAFVHSNYDGCIESAKTSSQTIINFLKSNGKL